MTRRERVEVRRLRRAIDEMAGRFGISCVEQGYATTLGERVAADRKASRQYAALLRLTTALERVATGRP